MNQTDTSSEHSSSPHEMKDLAKYAEGLDVLPPWKEADSKQRLRSIAIYFLVYFPVGFVLGIVAVVFFTLLLLYIYPLVALNDDDPAIWYWHSESELRDARARGWIVLALLVWIMFWLLLSFYKAIFTSPGNIPESIEWSMQDNSDQIAENKTSIERRIDGDIRHCVICARLKPDRTHHCRLCDMCVLKMDHHCPWIATCVGYYNYKYFFLLVVYSVLGLTLFTATFWETVVITINNEEYSTVFCLYVVGVYSLACMLTVVLVVFMGFHCYLVSNSMTTIEFCEKRKKWEMNDSIYKLSLYRAWQEALGRNPLMWFFPFSYRLAKDTGTTFAKFD